MAEVRSLHGATGDNCYVSEVCRSRRSYARHQRSRNAAQRQKHSERVTGLEANRLTAQPSAALIVVYRAPRYGALIDSIAVSVRQGRTQLALVQPIYQSRFRRSERNCLSDVIHETLRTYNFSLLESLPFQQRPLIYNLATMKAWVI